MWWLPVMGICQKGNYTGAATTDEAEDIMMAGVSSIDQMLQGVVPGMLVQQGTGMVGASPKIRVRGFRVIFRIERLRISLYYPINDPNRFLTSQQGRHPANPNFWRCPNHL